MRLRDDALDAPAEEGARALALALLARADRAAARLGRGGEALHDFRVAARRLRSALRAFRPWLDGGDVRRAAHRVRRLVRETNAARDAEVQRAWLAAARRADPSARSRPGLALAAERLGAARPPAVTPVAGAWRRASRKLRRALGARTRAGPADRTFAAALAALARAHADALRERVRAMSGPADAQGVHRARIAAKRLRYLLEPLAKGDAAAAAAVERARRLQDLLGALHDADVLAGALAAIGARGGRAPAGDPAPGLRALRRRAREEREARRAEVARALASGAVEDVADRAAAIAGALEARGGARRGAMELLVVRHGLAGDKKEFARTGRPDAERPLTKEGRKRFSRAARGITRLVPAIELLATSPLARAIETAELLGEACAVGRVVRSSELDPDADPDALLRWLRRHRAATVAVVGHEPHLSAFVAHALAGGRGARVELDKGGACLLEPGRALRAGDATLRWLLTQAQLERLR